MRLTHAASKQPCCLPVQYDIFMPLFSGESVSWCHPSYSQERLQQQRQPVVHRVGNFDFFITPAEHTDTISSPIQLMQNKEQKCRGYRAIIFHLVTKINLLALFITSDTEGDKAPKGTQYIFSSFEAVIFLKIFEAIILLK